ncbi:ATP-binding protein, partial [Flagellimonas onchidii]|uniref:ATP-binding protein n=1 Tax=Flagellimonas onchidii TaxID=2562684 RepID=UPI00145604F2
GQETLRLYHRPCPYAQHPSLCGGLEPGEVPRVGRWHHVIGEQTIADAILDRIVHSARRIGLKGESMRKKRKKKLNDENAKF